MSLSKIVSAFYDDTYNYHPDIGVRMKSIASPTLAYEFFQDLFNGIPFSQVKGKYGNRTVRVDDAFVNLEKNWGDLQKAARKQFGFN